MMLVASGISFARAFVVASILPVAEFGQYALVISVGTFFSSILSFGLVEKTLKDYPRLWKAGFSINIINDAKRLTFYIFLRAVILSIILLFLSYQFDEFKIHFLYIGPIAGSLAISALYASLNRATTNASLTANSSLLRATLAFVAAALGAFFLGIRGAILGEITGSLVGAVFTHQQCVREARRTAPSPTIAAPELPAVRSGRGGILVFLGFLAAAVPGLLDRSFVAWNFGAEALGGYAFLILFVTGANVLAGIIAQHVGPRLLTMEQAGATIGSQLRFILRWSLFFWAVWAAALGGFWLLSEFGLFDFLTAKYDVSAVSLAAVFALGALQLTVLFDFLLMSKDRENLILSAGLTYLVSALAAAAFVTGFKQPIIVMILLLSCAKLVHLGVQLWFVLSTRRELMARGPLA